MDSPRPEEIERVPEISGTRRATLSVLEKYDLEHIWTVAAVAPSLPFRELSSHAEI
jgi:hypothetical protein